MSDVRDLLTTCSGLPCCWNLLLSITDGAEMPADTQDFVTLATWCHMHMSHCKILVIWQYSAQMGFVVTYHAAIGAEQACQMAFSPA